MQKTTMLKNAEASNKNWYVIDASDKVLGRLAVTAANILRGKNLSNFTPNIDCGHNLVIINTNKVKILGNKLDNEYVYNHSQYLGGLRKRSYREMVEKYPSELIRNAVKNMLPKNRLSSKLINRLYLFDEEFIDTFKNSHNIDELIKWKNKI